VGRRLFGSDDDDDDKDRRGAVATTTRAAPRLPRTAVVVGSMVPYGAYKGFHTRVPFARS
jgi:hypothetical protein